MNTQILRTTVVVMKTLDMALSYWRSVERSVESASRQISDFVHRRFLLGRSTPTQPAKKRPRERDAAVKPDPALAATVSGHGFDQETSDGETGSVREKGNREGIERGENEGMAISPKDRTARRRKRGTAS
jgi:hypothetical protein